MVGARVSGRSLPVDAQADVREVKIGLGAVRSMQDMSVNPSYWS